MLDDGEQLLWSESESGVWVFTDVDDHIKGLWLILRTTIAKQVGYCFSNAIDIEQLVTLITILVKLLTNLIVCQFQSILEG